MAQSFWSKRKATIDTAGGYIKAADSVSRPTAVIMTLLGILIVGGLLFGVFTGTKWAYSKLTDDGNNVATTQKGTTNSGPSITATSSTSTTTPSPATTTPAPTTPTVAQPTTTPAVVATTTVPSKKIPQTGAGSNTTLFISVAVLGYILYRRRALKN